MRNIDTATEKFNLVITNNKNFIITAILVLLGVHVVAPAVSRAGSRDDIILFIFLRYSYRTETILGYLLKDRFYLYEWIALEII